VAIDISVADTARSYHVPLLMAPFSLTTYRGS
jgi:5-hydroxyisourate hydrolase-like protein (transthyretin family)